MKNMPAKANEGTSCVPPLKGSLSLLKLHTSHMYETLNYHHALNYYYIYSHITYYPLFYICTIYSYYLNPVEKDRSSAAAEAATPSHQSAI